MAHSLPQSIYCYLQGCQGALRALVVLTHQQGWRCTSKCTVGLTTLLINFLVHYYYYHYHYYPRPLSISLFNRQWPQSSPCWLELRPCDQYRTSHTIPLPFRHCSPVLGAWSRRVLLVFLFSLRIGQVFRLFVDSFVALTSQFLWRLDLIKSKLRAKKTDFY